MKRYFYLSIAVLVLFSSCNQIGGKITKAIAKETTEKVVKEGTEEAIEGTSRKAGKEIASEVIGETVYKKTFKQFCKENPALEKAFVKLSRIQGSPKFDYADFILKKGPHGGDLIVYKKSPRISIEIKGNMVYAKAGSTAKEGGINDLLNSLIPNKTYIIDDNFIYKTDNLGRIVEASADRTKAISEGIYRNPQRNSNVQSAVREMGLKTDDGGHIFANATNGPNEIINQIPMNPNSNRNGAWRSIERLEEEAIKAGKQVTSKRKLIYKGDSRRPAQIEVEIDIDGKITKEIIDNPM